MKNLLKFEKLRASGVLVEKIACICSVFCQFNEQKNRITTNAE